MGFLRRLFGTKKSGPPSDGSGHKPAKKDHNRRWSFGSKRDKSLPPPPVSSALNHFDHSSSSLDANKHAIAVAAATAAVAEAALAAAHAAAEVVRLTSGAAGGSSVASSSSRPVSSAARVGLQRFPEETAAVKIQSAFRGYLARRALRALKALVKLQALVRGHIVRKQSADMLRRMQTLLRLQAQARASRAHLSHDSFNSSLSHYPVPEEYELPHRRAYSTKFDGSSILKRCSSNANYRNIDLQRARAGSNWLDHWMEENVGSQTRNSLLRKGHPDEEKSDKILEVDTWKPHFNTHHTGTSFQTVHYYLNSDYNNEKFMPYDPPSKRSTSKALSQSLSSREVLPLSSLKFHKGKDEVVSSSRTADNSPQAFSSSSRGGPGSGARRGPFSPAKSECSWGFFSGYMGHPNYMANTESSLAKVRSQSAPRQRIEFERYSTTSNRSSVQGLGEMGSNSERDSDLRNRAFPATSRFNRIGSANLR